MSALIFSSLKCNIVLLIKEYNFGRRTENTTTSFDELILTLVIMKPQRLKIIS